MSAIPSPMPERRQSDPHLRNLCERVGALEEQLTAHLTDEEEIQRRFTAELASNTEMTARVERNTAVIVDAWQSLDGAFKVLRVVGRIAKYVGYILIAISAGWAVVKAVMTGAPPPTPGGSP